MRKITIVILTIIIEYAELYFSHLFIYVFLRFVVILNYTNSAVEHILFLSITNYSVRALISR